MNFNTINIEGEEYPMELGYIYTPKVPARPFSSLEINQEEPATVEFLWIHIPVKNMPKRDTLEPSHIDILPLLSAIYLEDLSKTVVEEIEAGGQP